MPDQLTHERATRLGRVVPALVQVAGVVVAFVVAGAVAGVVWEWLWTPPTGVVIDQRWLLDLDGLRAEFSGTGIYVLVASVVGLLIGALCGLYPDRSELVTLVAVLVGAALAGLVMAEVGQALGPSDPRELARTAAERTRLPGELVIGGKSPYLAFPTGATVGLAIVLLGLTRRHAD